MSEKNPTFKCQMRSEVKVLLVELSQMYHLSQSAIVTTAIVELYNARSALDEKGVNKLRRLLGPERKKRGNGHP